MAKAGRGSDQFPLRLPEGLRDRIKASAVENGRSMNAEIIEVLEMYFPDKESYRRPVNKLTDAEAEELWEWLDTRLNKKPTT